MRASALAFAILLAMLDIASAAATTNSGPASVAYAECRVTSPGATPGTLATPHPGTPDIAPPLAGVEEIEERDLPPGDDASADVAAALLAFERQNAACLNARDYKAVLDMLDAPLREEAAEIFAEVADLAASPSETYAEDVIATVALRCVRTYAGDYAAAVLDWDIDGSIESNVRIYRDTGTGWLLAGEVTAYGQQGEGCEPG